MLTIIYGENRGEAEKAVKKLLGENYEVFEGESLVPTDLPSIFRGTSLFEVEKRRILLKNLTENAAVWEKIADYSNTTHEVVIWEGKIDKRSSGYKTLKAAGIEMKEFVLLKKPEMNLVFGVLDLALKDGEKAVREVEKIEGEQDPYMFFGLLVTQVLKKFEVSRGGQREKRILKEMAELDLEMKSSTIEPWTLVKGFLLRVGTL